MRRRKPIQPLTELPNRFSGIISAIDSCPTIWQHLNEIGLRVGDRIETIRKAPFGGPLHLRCNGHDVAIGQALAQKILVEIEHD
jgi:Fe2+ transport system protein FeoA